MLYTVAFLHLTHLSYLQLSTLGPGPVATAGGNIVHRMVIDRVFELNTCKSIFVYCIHYALFNECIFHTHSNEVEKNILLLDAELILLIISKKYLPTKLQREMTPN